MDTWRMDSRSRSHAVRKEGRRMWGIDMRCREIIDLIEKDYPPYAALSFDNVGLLVGRESKKVKRVYLALDATGEVIEHAAAWGADMLITHHPLIFSPLKRVTMDDFVGKRVMALIRYDISYYAMHTNYDVLGMAGLAARKLDLRKAAPLDVTMEHQGKEEGVGRIGLLPQKMSLRECCEYVKSRLGLETVNVFGDLDMPVECLAISPGSGKSAIHPALEKCAQVLVCGDIGHHEGIDAWAREMAIIDAGHYGTEYMFLEDMEKYLCERLGGVDIASEPVRFPCRVV